MIFSKRKALAERVMRWFAEHPNAGRGESVFINTVTALDQLGALAEADEPTPVGPAVITAREHLRRVLSVGHHACGDPYNEHDADCPFTAATAFLAAVDQSAGPPADG